MLPGVKLPPSLPLCPFQFKPTPYGSIPLGSNVLIDVQTVRLSNIRAVHCSVVNNTSFFLQRMTYFLSMFIFKRSFSSRLFPSYKSINLLGILFIPNFPLYAGSQPHCLPSNQSTAPPRPLPSCSPMSSHMSQALGVANGRNTTQRSAKKNGASFLPAGLCLAFRDSWVQGPACWHDSDSFHLSNPLESPACRLLPGSRRNSTGSPSSHPPCNPSRGSIP